MILKENFLLKTLPSAEIFNKTTMMKTINSIKVSIAANCKLSRSSTIPLSIIFVFFLVSALLNIKNLCLMRPFLGKLMALKMFANRNRPPKQGQVAFQCHLPERFWNYQKFVKIIHRMLVKLFFINYPKWNKRLLFENNQIISQLFHQFFRFEDKRKKIFFTLIYFRFFHIKRSRWMFELWWTFLNMKYLEYISFYSILLSKSIWWCTK